MKGPTPKFYMGFGSTWTTLDSAIAWTDVTDYVMSEPGAGGQRGRSSELDDMRAGTFNFTLDNSDRRFDPTYTAGPYFGDLKPGVPVKVEATCASPAVPVTVASVLGEGTTVDAPTYTTASFTPVAGRHYIVQCGWAVSVATGTIATISTSTGLTFIPAAVGVAADGQAFARPSATRQTNQWIAYASGSPTPGTVTVTIPGGASFTSFAIAIAEITGAHAGASATDCLIQASRLDTQANATSVNTFLHSFTDQNNATLFLASDGVAQAMTAGTGLTSVVQGNDTTLLNVGIFKNTATAEVLEPSCSWASSASATCVAYEVRATDSQAPSTFDVVPLTFADAGSATSLTLTSVPFIAGRPCIVVITANRADNATTPTSVTGATNAFTLVGSSSFDTVAIPTRRILVYKCDNPAAVTENVVITWAATQSMSAAAALGVTGGSTAGLVAEFDGDTGDLATSLTGTLSAVSGGVLVFAGADAGSVMTPSTGSGLRRLFDNIGQSGNNGASWSSVARRQPAAFWRDTPSASSSVALATARDAGLMAVRLAPAAAATVPYVYPVFRGFVGGWPQDYDVSNNLATVGLSCTDGMAKLATAGTPSSVYALEVEADTPKAWWRLSETSGIEAGDSSDNGYVGTYADGTTALSTRSPNEWETVPAIKFDGDPRPMNVAAAAQAITGRPATITFLVNVSTIDFARSLPLLYYRGESFVIRYIWKQYPPDDPTPSQQDKWRLEIEWQTAAAPGSNYATTTLMAVDGQTHHVAARIPSAAAPAIYVDGVNATFATSTTSLAYTTGDRFVIGGDYGTVGRTSTTTSALEGIFGDISIFDTDIGTTRITAHAAAVSAPWDLDTTGARIDRVLGLGWPSDLVDTAAGYTTLGPAMLDRNQLQLIKRYEKAEQGRFFISRAGKATFLDRYYNQLVAAGVTSQATFSDDGSDNAYCGIAFDYDDRQVYNRVRASRIGGTYVEVYDQASIDTYGEQVDTSLGNLDLGSDSEARGLAELRLDRYKDPQLRARPVELKLHGLTAAQQADVLDLELGYRVTVERTPQSVGSAISQETIVEGISHRLSGGAWTTTLTLSPVDTRAYALWGSTNWGDTAGWGY